MHLLKKTTFRVLIWSIVALGSLLVSAGALIYYYYVPPPITKDADGYKTIRIFIDGCNAYRYGRPFVCKLIDNILSHIQATSGLKIRAEYVDRKAHIAIFVTDAPTGAINKKNGKIKNKQISRFRYQYSHPFSTKAIIQAADSPIFWCNTVIQDFFDYGLLIPSTSFVVGPQYSYGDWRYEYVAMYMILMSELFDGYPTLAHTQQVLDKICDSRAKNILKPRSKFCAFIYSYDDLFGLRTQCFEACSKLGRVDAMGRFFHNNDTLWAKSSCERNCEGWHARKQQALLDYKFNISIENVNTPGYVSEKLLDSLVMGCIPIYAGCENRPNPRVFNQDAILFWSYDGYNNDTINKIRQLNSDPDAYQRFISQPIFKSTAAAYITGVLEKLHNHLWYVLLATLSQFDTDAIGHPAKPQ